MTSSDWTRHRRFFSGIGRRSKRQLSHWDMSFGLSWGLVSHIGTFGSKREFSASGGPDVDSDCVCRPSAVLIRAGYMVLRSNASKRGWPLRGAKLGSIESQAGDR